MRALNIGLIGHGKTGKEIEKTALQKGHKIGSIFTTSHPLLHTSQLENLDVVIDFSHPDIVMKNVELSVQAKKPIIIGTTGCHDALESIKSLVKTYKTACVFAPNFSIGIYLFRILAREAARLLNRFSDYEMAGVEFHHKHKIDAPSGTALAITRDIISETQDDSFAFESVRCGSFPGTHSLYFDSPADTIILSHETRNRQGFAAGVIVTAEWLRDKEGFFTFDDVMKELLSKELSKNKLDN